MQKRIIAFAVSLFMIALAYAYNPPAGGQNFLRITEPQLLTGAGSCAGGAIFNGVTPASVINNPALTAFEQRIILDIAGTMLFDSSDSDHTIGGAFQTGIAIPSRWCVSSFLFQGVWVPFENMETGNSLNLNANFSKDLTDTLVVGGGVDFGIFYGHGTDWRAGANLGVLYCFGDVSFLRDVRFGAALTNLGKPWTDTTVEGITGSEASMWPGLATIKTGAAAILFSTDTMNLGASTDFSVPAFQNLVIDAGVQLEFNEFIKVSTSWEYDVRECAEGSVNLIPSVGLSFKFIFKAKEDSILTERGWQQSEMTVSAAWQNLYETVNAASVGAVINLGLKDTDAPEIILWSE